MIFLAVTVLPSTTPNGGLESGIALSQSTLFFLTRNSIPPSLANRL